MKWGGLILLFLVVSAHALDVNTVSKRARLLKQQLRSRDDGFLEVQTKDKEDEKFVLVATLIGVGVSIFVGAGSRAAGNAATSRRLAGNTKIREIQEKKEAELYAPLMESFKQGGEWVLTAYQKAAASAFKIARINKDIVLPDDIQVVLGKIILTVRPDLMNEAGRTADKLRMKDGKQHNMILGTGADVIHAVIHSAIETGIVEGIAALGAEGFSAVLGDAVLPGLGAVYGLGKLGVNIAGMAEAADRTERMITTFEHAESDNLATHLSYQNCKIAKNNMISFMELKALYDGVSDIPAFSTPPPFFYTLGTAWTEFGAAIDGIGAAVKKTYNHKKCKAHRRAKSKAKLPTCLTAMTTEDEGEDEGLCCPITQIWFTNAEERGADYKYKLDEVVDNVRTVEVSDYYETHIHARAPPCTKTNFPSVYVSELAQITNDDGPVKHVKDLYSNGPFNRMPFSPVFFTEGHAKQWNALRIADIDEDIPDNLINKGNFGADREWHTFSPNTHVYMLKSNFPGMPLVNIGSKAREHHPDGAYTRQIRDWNGGPNSRVYNVFQVYTPPAPKAVPKPTIPAEELSQLKLVCDYIRKAPDNAVYTPPVEAMQGILSKVEADLERGGEERS